MTRREQIAPVIPLRPARRAVTWEYVAEQLTCSRSKAYELLQQCAAEAGLPRESGATLRVDESIWLAFYRRNFECGSTNETGLTTPRFTSTKRTARARESASPPGAPTKPQPKLLQGGGNETLPIRPSRARGT